MNREQLAEENGLDLEELNMLIEVFQSSAKDHCNKLRAAIGSRDLEAQRSSLHKLAGCSAQLLGMGEINKIAREGECAIREGRAIDAGAILGRVETILKSEGLID